MADMFCYPGQIQQTIKTKIHLTIKTKILQTIKTNSFGEIDHLTRLYLVRVDRYGVDVISVSVGEYSSGT